MSPLTEKNDMFLLQPESQFSFRAVYNMNRKHKGGFLSTILCVQCSENVGTERWCDWTSAPSILVAVNYSGSLPQC